MIEDARDALSRPYMSGLTPAPQTSERAGLRRAEPQPSVCRHVRYSLTDNEAVGEQSTIARLMLARLSYWSCIIPLTAVCCCEAWLCLPELKLEMR
jgi:hypothetical protein